eukprot:gb/GEZN01001024.1/.p1 GENE.gb/GEZN01001024.1/~~gb/GEZN01001024.1/.p1  ORF type:complete len:1021 (-),score=218.54 gb/GEZN01001024.1/:338-3307(-)
MVSEHSDRSELLTSTSHQARKPSGLRVDTAFAPTPINKDHCTCRGGWVPCTSPPNSPGNPMRHHNREERETWHQQLFQQQPRGTQKPPAEVTASQERHQTAAEHLDPSSPDLASPDFVAEFLLDVSPAKLDKADCACQGGWIPCTSPPSSPRSSSHTHDLSANNHEQPDLTHGVWKRLAEEEQQHTHDPSVTANHSSWQQQQTRQLQHNHQHYKEKSQQHDKEKSQAALRNQPEEQQPLPQRPKKNLDLQVPPASNLFVQSEVQNKDHCTCRGGWVPCTSPPISPRTLKGGHDHGHDTSLMPPAQGNNSLRGINSLPLHHGQSLFTPSNVKVPKTRADLVTNFPAVILPPQPPLKNKDHCTCRGGWVPCTSPPSSPRSSSSQHHGLGRGNGGGFVLSVGLKEPSTNAWQQQQTFSLSQPAQHSQPPLSWQPPQPPTWSQPPPPQRPLRVHGPKPATHHASELPPARAALPDSSANKDNCTCRGGWVPCTSPPSSPRSSHSHKFGEHEAKKRERTVSSANFNAWSQQQQQPKPLQHSWPHQQFQPKLHQEPHEFLFKSYLNTTWQQQHLQLQEEQEQEQLESFLRAKLGDIQRRKQQQHQIQQQQLQLQQQQQHQHQHQLFPPSTVNTTWPQQFLQLQEQQEQQDLDSFLQSKLKEWQQRQLQRQQQLVSHQQQQEAKSETFLPSGNDSYWQQQPILQHQQSNPKAKIQTLQPNLFNHHQQQHQQPHLHQQLQQPPQRQPLKPQPEVGKKEQACLEVDKCLLASAVLAKSCRAGGTILSVGPHNSVLSAKALAAFKCAFLNCRSVKAGTTATCTCTCLHHLPATTNSTAVAGGKEVSASTRNKNPNLSLHKVRYVSAAYSVATKLVEDAAAEEEKVQQEETDDEEQEQEESEEEEEEEEGEYSESEEEGEGYDGRQRRRRRRDDSEVMGPLSDDGDTSSRPPISMAVRPSLTLPSPLLTQRQTGQPQSAALFPPAAQPNSEKSLFDFHST